MKTRQVVDTHIESIVDTEWLSYGEDEILVKDDESIEIAAKEWGINAEGVRQIRSALSYMAETIADELSKDLKDIWEKVDKF